MPRKKYLVVIGGPTASGKTKAAIKIANHFGVEIISADSRQFYREMNIGTAKPSKLELDAAPHHFINNLSIHDTYTAGDYEREVIPFLDNLYESYDMAILAGGSGFFIQAVIEGLDDFPKVPKEVRAKIEEEFQLHGIKPLREKVRAIEPEYFEVMDNKNPHRLIRVLSVYEASGQPFSSFLYQSPKIRNFEPIFIYLEMRRDYLYNRINNRVEKMINKGLIDEAYELYPFRHLTPLQTVGYKEIFAYYDGTISKRKAIDLIKQNTRRYAKRQTTWFRKKSYWNSFYAKDPEAMIKFISLKLMKDLELGG
ncbi:MAG: tRNA (adenosine(37)-N6)-dimethylallyltransferase MiaA [Bacteroidota bacterium]